MQCLSMLTIQYYGVKVDRSVPERMIYLREITANTMQCLNKGEKSIQEPSLVRVDTYTSI